MFESKITLLLRGFLWSRLRLLHTIIFLTQLVQSLGNLNVNINLVTEVYTTAIVNCHQIGDQDY